MKMRRKIAFGLSVGILSMSLAGIFSGCSPVYVIRAAYEHSKILCSRRPIAEVIADNETDAETKRKLALVLEARQYAHDKLGLDPGGSFRKYSKLDRDVLAWVLMGSRQDSFTLAGWWFPFVGTVPYKGFFEREDAEEAGKDLVEDGYEIWIRPTEAISTLGWFDDPVLSTTLRHSDHRIVNTVIHESVHTTVWLKGQVPFNETLANFIGSEGARRFFVDKLATCAGESECKQAQQSLSDLETERQIEDLIGSVISELYAKLNTLYQSDATREAKLADRTRIFEEVLIPLRKTIPTLRILKEINNAEIMQLKVYLTEMPTFARAFAVLGGDLARLMGEVRDLADYMDNRNLKDPYQAFRERIAEIEASRQSS